MSGGQNVAPGQGFGPNAPGQGLAPGQGYGPGVPGQGVYPDPTGGSAGTSGQGYFGPNYPPAGPDAGQGAAGPGYTPTSSDPSTSPPTPSPGTPFSPPNLPEFERTHFSLFGRPRKSKSDEENQHLTNQPQMMQRPPSHTGSVTISVSVSTSWLPRLTRHFSQPSCPKCLISLGQ